jgi:Glycosyl hydrolase family 26
VKRLLVVATALVTALACVAAVLGLRELGARGPGSRAAAPAARPGRPRPGLAAATAAASRPPASRPRPSAARAGCRGATVGVATDNLSQFEASTGIYPAVAVKYFDWGSPFPASTILQNHGIGVATQVVLKPVNISLQEIADGGADAFLASWADADRRLDLPVILSFAPEANGNWYEWGYGHVSAALYKRAWRHIHEVFADHGARRLTWLWQVNVAYPSSEPLRALWPGPAYVSEVGIDGPLRSGQAFSAVFGSTIRLLRAITHRPVAISEISVHRGPSRVRQINELFAAMCRDRLAGFVWFDIRQTSINYQLEGDPAALAAFRADARELAAGR